MTIIVRNARVICRVLSFSLVQKEARFLSVAPYFSVAAKTFFLWKILEAETKQPSESVFPIRSIKVH